MDENKLEWHVYSYKIIIISVSAYELSNFWSHKGFALNNVGKYKEAINW